MNHVSNQFPMSNAITSQFVRHNLPGLAPMTSWQPLEEALSGYSVTLSLQVDVHYLAILIYSSPMISGGN